MFSGLPLDIAPFFLSMKKSTFPQEQWILCYLKTSLELLIPCSAGTAVECAPVLLPDCAHQHQCKDVSPHAERVWQLQGPDDKLWNLFFPVAAHGVAAGFLASFSVSWLVVMAGGKSDFRKEAGICLLVTNIPFCFLPYFSHFILLRWHFVFVLVDITYLTPLVF